MQRGKSRSRPVPAVAVMALVVAGCGQSFLSLLFDVKPRVEASAPRPGPPTGFVAAGAPTLELPPPPIEGTLHPDTAVALLPRDAAGNIDWMAALREGVIRPRSSLPGRTPVRDDGFRFAFDFLFPGPDTMFDASFPHSSHTEWLDCRQCHSRIFPYRGTKITMADVLQGRFCGECHGKVAYPVTTGCERCHTRLTMPPGRAKPDLLGTVVMKRVTGERPDTAVPVSVGVRSQDMAPARFPHWVHRVRYRCKTCHMELFEPRAGANAITMSDITSGRACGACHNGETAFQATFGACERCHVSELPPARPTGTPAH